jgi:MYXO-CTERM domain-containing protein
MSKFLAASAGLALAAGALAGNTYGPGPGAALPDNTPAGFNSVINVGDSFSIADVSVTITGFQSTWVGDIIATLSNGTTTINLMNRIGSTTPAGVGDSSDLGGTYTFADGGANLTAAALAAGAFDVIAPGTYAASGFNNTPVGMAAAFAGQNSAGAWTLNVSDNAAADANSFTGWTLTLTPVPTPGAAALLGLAGVAGLRRRR